MNDTIISVKNLTKIYHLYDHRMDRLKEALDPRRKSYHHDYFALNDVSFEIKKGETVGIIGKNGSGKSTLLKILTGVLTPTAGTVQVNGRVSALLELGTGFNPELTGIENVYFNGTLLGFTKQQMDAKLDDILAFADIGEFAYQPVKTYSSGMFIGLAFSVIVYLEPEILIIDEALSVGDVFFQQKCMRFMRRFKDDGGTILFVSHDTAAVLSLSEKGLMLKNGVSFGFDNAKIICEKYLKELYSDKKNSISDVKRELVAIVPKYTYKSSTYNGKKNIYIVSPFNSKADSLGIGGAKILDASFIDSDNKLLTTIISGEITTLRILIEIQQNIDNPVIAIIIKDKNGQFIFTEATNRFILDESFLFKKDMTVTVDFSFIMPEMITGNYLLDIGIADGDNGNHVQHHWIHDALLLQSTASSLIHGLCGLLGAEIVISRTTRN